MFRKNSIRVAAVGVLAGALVAGSALSAQAADEPVATVGSKGPVYIADANNGDIYAAGTSLPFEQAVIGRPNDTDVESKFPGSSDATSVRTFISNRGDELDQTKWIAFGLSDFVEGSKDVWLPQLQLSAQTGGAQATVRAGGNFSVGFAFMKNNQLTVAEGGVYYTYITVQPGGQWKFATPTSTTPEEPAANTFDVNLNAETMSAPDGALSLSAPSVATATIGNPAMVDGLSTSTGTLGDFTVTDERYTSHPGWTLTTTVTQFTNSADNTKVIAASQLGVAPKLVAPNANVTVASPQVAGSASYPSLFAQSNATAASGAVQLNADLKFVSPSNMPAGTYTSKLTLTLASK